ncbi:MAG: hypothetical protein DID92_2727744389 [Candidatus Nitrotoga sp. SPKER]|nr:MAG: hypothetical protein DID92_2727744389 [Candidatus Nitrotoga sp. SPKER]
MQIKLVNDDTFGNNIRVTDSNADNAEIFNGYINAHEEVDITCKENDSGYGNIITYQDTNPKIERSFLHEGDRISL